MYNNLFILYVCLFHELHVCLFYSFKELESAQETFVQLLGQLKPECKLQFLDWVHSEYSQTTAAGTHQANSELEELPDEPGTDCNLC